MRGAACLVVVWMAVAAVFLISTASEVPPPGWVCAWQKSP